VSVAALRTREVYETEENEWLAPQAVRSSDSMGRLHEDPEHLYRTAFQRDRDRIVHSRAFRRLEYKTQVFAFHEGDHYRNRLTHTLEGAQIARTIARALRLNEDLAEAIALAHDMGHTPFGHAGERVLARLLGSHGGFDHNRQTLRVVDLLEERSPRYRGLNLTGDTREGILKHGCSWPHPVALPPLEAQLGLEAQVANAADEIAYVNHDLDDALRFGVLELDAMKEVSLVGEAIAQTAASVKGAPAQIRRARVIVALIERIVTDLVESTSERIARSGLGSVAQVRKHAEPLVEFSPEVGRAKGQLKKHLFDNFYHHPRVLEHTQSAEVALGELFAALLRDPGLLPDSVRERFPLEGEARAIADYVAGMTDRFALAEHERLLGSEGVENG
jgi:dGTPase